MALAPAGSIAQESPEALLAAALEHLGERRLDQAEDACKRLLASDPRHADALHLRGLISAQAGQLDLAIDFIAQAIRIEQTNPDYFLNLGRLLTHRARFDEALTSFDIALKLRPDFVAAWLALGDGLQKQQRFQDALLAFDHGLKLDPRNAAAAEKGARLLLDLKRFDEAAAFFGRLIEIDPGHYEARNLLGGALASLGRFEDAADAFSAAAAIRPDAPAAFNNLGIALTDLRRHDEAVAALDRAIAAAPDLAEPYNNRGNALKAQNRFAEALADYERAIALKPAYAEAHGNRGACLDELARPDEAFDSFRAALALQPDHADAHWNLAVNRLRAGDFRAGWREAEWRWKSAGLGLKLRGFDQPLWLGEQPIAGKVLLVYNEQGLGDAIQFCRYVPLLAARGAKVVLEISAALQQLLRGMGGVVQCVAKGEALPAFDLHCPLTSLPLAFDTTLDTIPSDVPYLSVPSGARDWKGWLGAGSSVLIGLVWSGNPNHINDHNRSIALRTLAPLFDIGAQFVSLQKNAREADLEMLRGRSDILDAASLLETFTDTAALVAQLDLVVSVDTSVAHLAGALGKPVFILLPHVADCRWLTGRANSPWYPSARLFRQGEARDWAPVVLELREALQRVGTPFQRSE